MNNLQTLIKIYLDSAAHKNAWMRRRSKHIALICDNSRNKYMLLK